jgi:UDP-glucuronate 4-epimerase
MMPYSAHQNANHPLSLYAATKKSNELMAHSYSYLYGLPTTGLRFFTVYGPWGRPDMALFKFTKAILAGEPIQAYGYGKHQRDFTFIDDIVEGVLRVLDCPALANNEWNTDYPDPATSSSPWRIYNIGNGTPVNLMEYIQAIEKALGKNAEIKFMPPQPGDVKNTHADIDDLIKDYKFRPVTNIEDGVAQFISWYRDYYHV